MNVKLYLEIPKELKEKLDQESKRLECSKKDIILAGIDSGIEIIENRNKNKPSSLVVEILNENTQEWEKKEVSRLSSNDVNAQKRCATCKTEHITLMRGAKLAHHMEHKLKSEAVKCPVSPYYKRSKK